MDFDTKKQPERDIRFSHIVAPGLEILLPFQLFVLRGVGAVMEFHKAKKLQVRDFRFDHNIVALHNHFLAIQYFALNDPSEHLEDSKQVH